jgi:hypothetical protein
VIPAAAQGAPFGGNLLTGASMGWLSHHKWDFFRASTLCTQWYPNGFCFDKPHRKHQNLLL